MTQLLPNLNQAAAAAMAFKSALALEETCSGGMATLCGGRAAYPDTMVVTIITAISLGEDGPIITEPESGG